MFATPSACFQLETKSEWFECPACHIKVRHQKSALETHCSKAHDLSLAEYESEWVPEAGGDLEAW
jgi:hypothetical protein